MPRYRFISIGGRVETFVVGSASATIICDSIFEGSRLTSVEAELPRPYLAELNTHCRASRNSASSRAIPGRKRLAAVLRRPYVPNSFGANKAGMQAGADLSNADRESAKRNWEIGRDLAVVQAYALMGGRKEILATAKGEEDIAATEMLCDTIEKLSHDYGLGNRFSTQSKGLHKQHATRVLEVYSYHTVILTATHWRNLFGLRASTMAQPEMDDLGIALAMAMRASTPTELAKGEWHLPYIRPEDRAEATSWFELAYASAGKCARLSYETQAVIRALMVDVEKAKELQGDGHMSPFQHPARPWQEGDPVGSHGNYSRKWTQLRKLLENEDDFTKLISREALVEGCRGDEELADFILSLPE